MASEERRIELLKEIHDSVVQFEEETCVELCEAALKEEVDAYDGIMNGLAAGMETVGKLYEDGAYYVPELLLCSDAMYSGMEVLRPHIKSSDKREKAGKIILGVVEGDIHDIGKTLVKTMFEAGGWEIFDLGRDVVLDRFVEELKETNADVVGLSALMTTSMMAIPKVIQMLKDHNPKVKVIVGGAPMSAEIAQQYGADGYADDAVTAVKEAERLISV